MKKHLSILSTALIFLFVSPLWQAAAQSPQKSRATEDGGVKIPTVQNAQHDEPSNDEPRSVKVGDSAFGGIVFYVTASGNHGLIAATEDQSESTNWFTAQNSVSNPANHDKAGQEYTDWRLPTKYELDVMYKALHLNKLGNFANEFYWSSTESDMPNSWRQHFESGRQALINKESPGRVRAVRSF